MAGGARPLAVPARTGGVVRPVAVLARQAGARLPTVPVRPRGTRRGAALIRRPLMARAGIPRRTSAAVVRRPARLTGPAVPHARLPETDHGGPAGLPRAGSIAAAGPLRAVSLGTAVLPRAGNIGVAGLLRAGEPAGLPQAGIAAAPGPRTTAGLVLGPAVRRPAVRPAEAPVAGPHRTADLAVRRREACAATLRRVATSEGPRGRPTPGHGGPHRGTQGETRGPRAALRDPGPALKAAVEIRTARARGQRAKGHPLVMAAVTGHRGQPAPGHATAGLVIRGQAVAGRAPGTRHGLAAGVQTRPRPAVTHRPTRPGRKFLIRSAPSSLSRRRGPS
jgi:hypothetical protein